MENFVKGKRVLFMGDSITALYLGERGWPKYFAELLEPAHTACTAVAGARWRDYPDTVWDGNPRFTPNEPMPHNTMCNQMEKIRRLHAAGDPDYADFDVVLMACGTNDGMPEPGPQPGQQPVRSPEGGTADEGGGIVCQKQTKGGISPGGGGEIQEEAPYRCQGGQQDRQAAEPFLLKAPGKEPLGKESGTDPQQDRDGRGQGRQSKALQHQHGDAQKG